MENTPQLDEATAKKKCDDCYKFRDELLKSSPAVIYMSQQIEKLAQTHPKYRFQIDHIDKSLFNKKTDEPATNNNDSKSPIFIPSKHLICDICPDNTKLAGFHPDLGILICANQISSSNKFLLESSITHEMIHYYDNMRFKVNLNNLKHHACTEIRASMLSGECAMSFEFFRKFSTFKMFGGFKECVRRRATLSVTNNPNCESPEVAQKVVDEVWNSCFGDTRPFDDVFFG
ncbi:hypothetical protein ACO0SA_003534 [Hanseniaspora valbyensis]